jgi:alpha-tubulin suppressor-like RCC1 family protein
VKGVNGGGVLSGVIALAAAQNHTCALLAAGSGTVKCWGQNNDGVLGNGSTKGKAALTPSSVTGLTRVASISTSINDTCAVLQGGTVKCWGFSQYGELGPGVTGPDSCDFGEFTLACSATPMTVKGISNVSAVSVREHSACAIVKSGKVVCWGDSKKNFNAVPGVSNATAITSSGDAVLRGDYSCVLLATHTVKCWGYNHEGELGNGATKNAATPTNVVGLSGASAISAGVTFACARLMSGAARCWGANNYGQLGNGGGSNKTKPVKVFGF